MPRYEVPIYYRGLSNYIVDAENEEEAMRLAKIRFANGDEDVLGNEFETIEKYGDITEPEEE